MAFNDISHRFMRRAIAIEIDDESKINKFAEFVCNMGITEPKKYGIGDILLKSFDGPQAIICKPMMCKMLHIKIMRLSEIDESVKFENNKNNLDSNIEVGRKEDFSRSYCFYNDNYFHWNYPSGLCGVWPIDGSNDDIDDFGDFD